MVKKQKAFPESTPRKFPQTVVSGNSTVTMYHGFEKKKNGARYHIYRIQYSKDGVRKFHRFSTYEEARAKGNEMLGQLSAGAGDVITLANLDRTAYLTAIDALQPTGLAIDRAAIQLAEVLEILDGVGSPAEAARFYANHRRKAAHVDMTVEKLVDEFIKVKTAAKKSARYLYDLNYRLGKIKAAFQCNAADVGREGIEKFLTGLNLGARSYNNFRDVMITLFRFAKKRNCVPADWNELATVEAINDKGGAIEIFTPEELSALLEHADETLIPFLCIGAFSGVRSAEILRMDWKSINFETGEITVEADNAKTATRRNIPITANLAAWLKPRAQKQGPVITITETWLYAELRDLAATSKTKWKDNGLRHSYISYRMAVAQDAAKVSLEAGNSPQMIFSNYRKLVTAKEAARWFSIAPDESAKGKITLLNVA